MSLFPTQEEKMESMERALNSLQTMCRGLHQQFLDAVKMCNELQAEKNELINMLSRLSEGMADCLKSIDVAPEEDDDWCNAQELLARIKQEEIKDERVF